MKGSHPLTISLYPQTKYCFASPEDTCTIFQALQHPAVYMYLLHPGSTKPPFELARVLSPTTDTYTVGIAEQLVECNMVPQDDEQREMLEMFEKRREGLLARSKFFYDILGTDMKWCQTLPCIFYPLIYDYTPEQVSEQLFELMPQVSIDLQRVFFRLVCKFTPRNRKSMTVDAFDVCLLDWKFPRRQSPDPNMAIYLEAAEAVWDYIEDIMLDYSVYDEIESYAQSSEKWIKWMRDRGTYPNFLKRIDEKCRTFNKPVSIFKHFIWKYISQTTRKKRAKSTLFLL